MLKDSLSRKVVKNSQKAPPKVEKEWFWAISRPPLYKTRTRYVTSHVQAVY